MNRFRDGAIAGSVIEHLAQGLDAETIVRLTSPRGVGLRPETVITAAPRGMKLRAPRIAPMSMLAPAQVDPTREPAPAQVPSRQQRRAAARRAR